MESATKEFSTLLDKVKLIGKNIIKPNAYDVDLNSRFPNEAIEALKEINLLSAYVPAEFGGMGLNLVQISKICETLGHYCGSTAMIYAMHKIQVACVVHHHQDSEFFKNYLQKLVKEQRLMASATTEIGVGGDLRSSICGVEIHDQGFQLSKQAPVISYAENADDLMITARRHQEAAASDQVQVLLHKDQYKLEGISNWDTMGFRGTCSSGFNVTSIDNVPTEQILPTEFADILSHTMHPYAHITWSSLWSGIAADAVNNARFAVRAQALQNSETPPISAIRLGEVDGILQTMRANNQSMALEYQQLLITNQSDDFTNFGFSIRTNNLKISSSQLIVDIVGKAMLICGISSYRNDSKNSLSRHLRDAYGAALMVNNDRILLHNSTLQLMHRE